MKFLEEIQVRLDEVVCLGIAELLKSPSMGEFTRQEFVDGWKGVGYIYIYIYILYMCYIDI
jgi:DCN1-like protein 1/2